MSEQATLSYCTRCGSEIETEASFCGNCGKPIIETSVVGKPRLDAAEHILGRIISPRLRKGTWGMRAMGFGIYTTDRRIVGVVSSKGRAERVGGAIGGILVAEIARGFTKEPDIETIEELEKRKNFELFRENISQIEIQKSHLKITPFTGEPETITVYGKKEREILTGLMRRFCENTPIKLTVAY